MYIKISNEELTKKLINKEVKFPKYTTQIINLANQNSQGTRPKIVGKMSDLIKEFSGITYDDWVDWYLTENPKAINEATNKTYGMILKFQDVITSINKKLVKKWIKDLVLTKTFVGLNFHKAILIKVSEQKKLPYKLSSSKEESKGIDGYIGDIPVSIKPITYKTKNMLYDNIRIKIIYYEKKKDGIKILFDF